MYVYEPCVCLLPMEGNEFSGKKGTDDCKCHGYWNQKPNTMKEQWMLLTAETSFQSCGYHSLLTSIFPKHIPNQKFKIT